MAGLEVMRYCLLVVSSMLANFQNWSANQWV